MRKTLLPTLFLQIFVVLVFASVAMGQQIKTDPERIALVIGNNAYTDLVPLTNPVNDAKAFAALLRKHGVTVFEHTDIDYAAFKKALADFARHAKGAREAIIFYAGHGMTALQDNRLKNVLVPTDASISCQTRAAQRTITMREIAKTIEGVPKQVLLFDSCRDEPLRDCQGNALTASLKGFQPARMTVMKLQSGKSRSAGQGRGYEPLKLKEQAPSTSILVAYSTDLGATAADGPPGQHSPFAQALLAELNAAPALPLYKILVKSSTRTFKNAGQRPWVVTKGGEPDICLRGRDCETSGALKAGKQIAQSKRLAQLASQQGKEGDSVTGLLLALEAFPEKTKSGQASFPKQMKSRLNVILDRLWRARHEVRNIKLCGDSYITARAMSFSRNGKLVAANCADSIEIRDTATGRLVGIMNGQELLTKVVAFSASGRRLASGGFDKKIHIWDVKTGRQTGMLKGHKNYVYSIAWSPDGKYIVSKSDYGKIRLWDVERGKELRVMQEGNASYTNIVFSPNGQYIVGASSSRTMALWDVKSGKKRLEISGPSYIRNIANSPDGEFIAIGTGDSNISLYNQKTGKVEKLLKGHEKGVTSLSFSLDSKRLVSGSFDNSVRLWEVASGKQLALFKGHQKEVIDVAFSWDAKLVNSISRDGTFRQWDVGIGKPLILSSEKNIPVLSAEFSPNGSKIAVGSVNSIRIWDIAGNKQLTTVDRGRSAVSLAYSPDGKRLAAGSWVDGMVHLWNVGTGKKIAIFKGHQKPVSSLSFSPDGKKLASGSEDKSIRIWDATTGELQSVLMGSTNKITDVAFSPDSKQIVSCAYIGEIRIWNAETGKQIQELKLDEAKFELITSDPAFSSVAFSPNGKYIAGGSVDSEIIIWEVASGKNTNAWSSGDNIGVGSRSLSFSPDSRRIVSGYSRNILSIWDVETGLLLSVLKRVEVERGIEKVTFSPDGKLIASTSAVNSVQLWKVLPFGQALVDHVKRGVPRCLTPTQREDYSLPHEPPAWCYDLKKWPYHEGRPKPVAAK